MSGSDSTGIVHETSTMTDLPSYSMMGVTPSSSLAITQPQSDIPIILIITGAILAAVGITALLTSLLIFTALTRRLSHSNGSFKTPTTSHTNVCAVPGTSIPSVGCVYPIPNAVLQQNMHYTTNINHDSIAQPE